MATKFLDVVVIGGSLAGLMQGIMMKRLGHNVRILEQFQSSSREGQAAGMSTGPRGQEFLAKHDLVQDQPHFVSASQLRILDVDLNPIGGQKVAFKMTNWKTLYYRLRANFDGLASNYVPVPPPTQPADGPAAYETGKRVHDISYDDTSGLTITVEDVASATFAKLHLDLIVAADGANSTVRRLLFPTLETSYSGYLAWRGVIPESKVSEQTMRLLENYAIWYHPSGTYLVIDIIPGEKGSIQPGERHVNLVWYCNCAKDSSEYVAAMTDIDGLQHQRTVPFGKVAPQVWAKKQAESAKFAAAIEDLVAQIESPFVTAISDCLSPECSFYKGKLFLVGDALALFRPHVGQSTNQSALHCLLLEKFLLDKTSLAEYEEEAMEYAQKTLLWSREVGSRYLS